MDPGTFSQLGRDLRSELWSLVMYPWTTGTEKVVQKPSTQICWPSAPRWTKLNWFVARWIYNAPPQGVSGPEVVPYAHFFIRSQRSRWCMSLEIMFAVLRMRWKHHKSKDRNFLHRSYTPKKISAPKKKWKKTKKIKFQKKMTKHFRRFWSIFDRKKMCVENIFWHRKCCPLFWILCRHFFEKKISSQFFLIPKKYFFSELRKKIGYVFDVKISNPSIYDVFSAFWAL